MTRKSQVLLRPGILGALLLLGPACAKGPRFDYTYKRPAALGPLPDSVALVVPASAGEEARDRGERKALSLANALGIRLERLSTVRSVDQWSEILRLRDARYRLKVYLPSGMVKFRDTKLYNQTLTDQESRPALTRDSALARAREVLKRLVDAGLVNEAQLLLSAAQVSYRKEQSTRGARQGETGRHLVPPSRLVDTRIFVPRVISGLGVSGNGLRLTLAAGGELAGLDLLWRDVTSESQRFRVRLPLDEAMVQFQKSAGVPANAMVDVLTHDLVYFDPSMRDAVAFLEPAYLFVYRVKVPIEGRPNEFRISKVLHSVIPATAHGRQQLPSARAARLAEFRAKLDTTRPAHVTPSALKEEDEVPAGVCPGVRAPRAALQLALNEPEIIEGWGRLADSTAPFDAGRNPSRSMLTLRNPSAPYNARLNPLVFRASCT